MCCQKIIDIFVFSYTTINQILKIDYIFVVYSPFFSLMMLSKFDINYTFLLLKHGATRNNRENQVLQTNTEPLDFI